MQWTLLLVHSPLLGPSSWEPFDQLASRLGHTVARPDLTRAASGGAKQIAAEAADAASRFEKPVAVLGHSGAGVVLPLIGELLSGIEPALVFVDAVVPPSIGLHRTPQQLVEVLDRETIDGWLHPWLDWWPSHVIDELLPHPHDQEALRADMPRLRRSFYDLPIPMPDGWSDRPCGYVQTSAGYDADRSLAKARGWPTRLVDGHHLSTYSEPPAVLAAVEQVLGELALR